MQHIKDIISERNGEIIEYARQKYGNRFDSGKFKESAKEWFNKEYPYLQDQNKYYSFEQRNYAIVFTAAVWFVNKFGANATFTHPES